MHTTLHQGGGIVYCKAASADIQGLSRRMQYSRRNPMRKLFPPTLLAIAFSLFTLALVATSQWPDLIRAVVSRGGRPDLAGPALPLVRAPTLLIVGDDDTPVFPLNRQAFALLRAEKQLVIVPGATHLFEEPGTLDGVAKLACDWFLHHLGKPSA